MKRDPNVILMTLFWFLFLISSCADKSSNKTVVQSAVNNEIKSKTMLDGNDWTTENLNLDISDSYCPKNDSTLCAQYGRLYTWEAAKKGCDFLGEGWRLPTNEEWQKMAKYYGGVLEDSNDHGQSAYSNLIAGGSSGFNALMAGNREANGDYKRFEAHGFYWTASDYDSSQAWFYNFGKGSTLLNHHTGDKQLAISVRCIKINQKP